jgi:DNA repair protein RadD
MIWNYWNTRQLQSALHEIDSELYDNLTEMLPPLRGDSFDPTEIDSKENLVKLLMAFAPSDYFSKRKNMELCLSKLPPDVMRKLAKEVSEETGKMIDHKSFGNSMEKLVSIRWSDRNYALIFLEFFSLPIHFMPPEISNVPSFVDIEPIAEGNPPIIARPFMNLIDFQNQVFMDSMKRLQIPRSRFIVQMPTGSGKTRTTMEIISNHLKQADEGAIVIWLAHSRELCEQAFQCFIEVWQYLSNKPLKAVRCWGNHPMPPAYDKSMFIIGGFQKVHSILRKDENAFEQLSKRTGLIVIDEAHKAVAPTYKNAISCLKGENTNIIGLTATPGRTEIEETEEMAEFFFESKVNISTPTGISEIEMLKSRNVLARIYYVPIISPIELELTPRQRKTLEESFDFPPGFLKKVAANNIRNIEILKKLLFSCREGRKILLFSCSVAHSKFIMSMLIYFGINAAHVDGSTSNPRREQVIQEFKQGGVQVLCNYGVLTTGFDAPNTDEIFIARPTNSVVLYSQMIGRGLRGPVIGGTARCRISDVKDNIQGFGNQVRVYHWFEDFWDN